MCNYSVIDKGEIYMVNFEDKKNQVFKARGEYKKGMHEKYLSDLQELLKSSSEAFIFIKIINSIITIHCLLFLCL